MNLLFDENISYRVIDKISSVFPGTNHVRNFDLSGKSDFVIYQFAKENSFCIVTFDEDFNNLSLLHGYPPKVIWLRTGNISTKYIAELLISKQLHINNFLFSSLDKDLGCLEIY